MIGKGFRMRFSHLCSLAAALVALAVAAAFGQSPPAGGSGAPPAGPHVLFDGAFLCFEPGGGAPAVKWPAHNNTRCGHAKGKHARHPSDPACKCPILPGTYRLGRSEKAGRFFGGIWIPIEGIPRARTALGTRHCGIHSHPTSWRTRSAGCIQMKKADAFALARLVDAALARGTTVPIIISNPAY